MSYNPDDPGSLSVSNKDPQIQKKIDKYWNMRSRGYNLATTILLRDTKYYETIINILLPPGTSADVLDIATGCGEMAIIASRLGHKVTAVDNSERMLYYAERNAEKNNLDIRCMKMDMADLRFDRASFDLLIIKSAVWQLLEPVKTIKSWVSLIRPGGHILIIDSNYYLGHFDPDYRRLYEHQVIEREETSGTYAKTNIDKVSFDTIHQLSNELPVCKLRRPSWDVSVLLSLGLENIRVSCTDDDPFQAPFDAGFLNLPMDFVVGATVPLKDVKNVMDNVQVMDLLSEEKIQPSEDYLNVLKAMADGNRLKILNILYVSDMNVTRISEISRLSLPHISYNLKILKSSGLVKSYKSGKETYYMLSSRQLYSDYIRLRRRTELLNQSK